MNDDLILLAFTSLIFTLSVFYIANKPKTEKESEPKTKSKSKPKSDEVIDTLDWMLANNIIDQREYTKLMGKCLQYL